MDAKKLSIYVILCRDRGYYSTRTGGSAFREHPEEFTIFRNAAKAQKKIRDEQRNLAAYIKRAEEIDRPPNVLQSYRERLAEWDQAEVVHIVY